MRFSTTLLLVSALAVAVYAQSQMSLRVWVIANLQNAAVKSAIVNSIVPTYMTNLQSTYSGVSFAPITAIDSSGSLLVAMSNLQTQLTTNTAPHVIIVADATVTTVALQGALQQNGVQAVIIMATANPNTGMTLLSAPQTLRIFPQDWKAASATASFVGLLGYDSFAVIQPSDAYGDSYGQALRNALQFPNAPNIVLTARLAPQLDTKADDAVLQAVINSGVGVVVVLGETGISKRVFDAIARLPTGAAAVVAPLVLLSKGAMLDLPTTRPARHAVVSPTFRRRALMSTGTPLLLPATSSVGDDTAYIASFIADALELSIAGAVAARTTATANLITAMQGARLVSSLTGPLSIDVNGDRVEDNFDLLQFTTLAAPTAQPTVLASWTRATGAYAVSSLSGVAATGSSTTVNINVCLAVPDTCSDYANVVHAVVVLLQANDVSNPNKLPAGARVQPVVIPLGFSAVDGLNAGIANFAQCNVIIGPARTSLAVALNPVITYYGIPTLDYSATSAELSDPVKFPYFSRVVPSDVYTAQVVASLAKKFTWDPITIITTADPYGASAVAQLTKALQTQTLTVEKSYYLTDTDAGNQTLVKALGDIRDNLITRIVIIALSTSDVHMRSVFQSIVALNMTGSHIFMLSDALCQFSLLNPTLRAPLRASFCFAPAYNKDQYQAAYVAMLKRSSTDAATIMTQAQFVSKCTMTYSDMYSAFANDAAAVIVDTVSRIAKLRAANGSSFLLNNGTAFRDMIRATRIIGTTGIISFSNGDRVEATYTVNAQQDSGLVDYASWNILTGLQLLPLLNPLVWPDNTTNIPKASTRSLTYIAYKTATTNPGAVVFSIIGFVGTIGMAVFCYKHSQMKKQLEKQRREAAAAAAHGKEMAAAKPSAGSKA